VRSASKVEARAAAPKLAIYAYGMNAANAAIGVLVVLIFGWIAKSGTTEPERWRFLFQPGVRRKALTGIWAIALGTAFFLRPSGEVSIDLVGVALLASVPVILWLGPRRQ
jgi:hypothetical protein